MGGFSDKVEIVSLCLSGAVAWSTASFVFLDSNFPFLSEIILCKHVMTYQLSHEGQT